MVREDFNNFLVDLSAFYERRQTIGQKTFDLWFDKIKNIPAESLKWILTKIEDESEIFPRNITSSMWAFYYNWIESNPEKKAHKDYFDCPDCDEGLIFATKKKNGTKYRYVYRCSKCRQSNVNAYPIISRLELLRDHEIKK